MTSSGYDRGVRTESTNINTFLAAVYQHLIPLSTRDALIKVTNENKKLLKGVEKGAQLLLLEVFLEVLINYRWRHNNFSKLNYDPKSLHISDLNKYYVCDKLWQGTFLSAQCVTKYPLGINLPCDFNLTTKSANFYSNWSINFYPRT